MKRIGRSQWRQVEIEWLSELFDIKPTRYIKIMPESIGNKIFAAVKKREEE